MIETIPIEKLQPSPDNPRRAVGDVSDLAASIRSVGILEPLVVIPVEGAGYQVVLGHRRLAGAKVAGFTEVPAIVRELDDATRVEMMAIENLQREDLTPLEEADAFRRLVDLGHSQRELAERVGRSQSHVSKRLALLELPAVARQELDSGGITLDAALELTRVKDLPEAKIVDTLEWIKEEGHWEEPKHIVESALRDWDSQQATAAAQEKLRSEGATVVEYPDYRAKAKVLGKWSLDLDARKHSKEPCHAKAVDPQGKIVNVCTDPQRHANKGASELKAKGLDGGHSEDPQRAKAKKEEKARRQAAKVRLELMRSITAKKKHALGDVMELVAGQLVRSVHDSARSRLACEILQVKPKGKYGYSQALEEFASAGGQELLRAALAVALAIGDDPFQKERVWNPDPSVGPHFDFLIRHGYEADPAELKLLKKMKVTLRATAAPKAPKSGHDGPKDGPQAPPSEPEAPTSGDVDHIYWEDD